MIARVWRGWTSPADAAAYVEHLRSATFPALGRLEGFEGGRVLRREIGGEIEFLVETEWRSPADISAFAGEDIDMAVVPPEAAQLLTRYEPTVAHYELASGS